MVVLIRCQIRHLVGCAHGVYGRCVKATWWRRVLLDWKELAWYLERLPEELEVPAAPTRGRRQTRGMTAGKV